MIRANGMFGWVKAGSRCSRREVTPSLKATESMTQTASCRYLVLEGAYLLGCIEGPCTPLQFLWAELTRLDVGLDHVLCDAFYGKHTVLKHIRPQHVHLKLSGSVLKLTDFQHGTAFG